MPLAEFRAIAPPRQIAEAQAVVADDMNIRPGAAHQGENLPARGAVAAVVLLDEDVVRGLGIARAAILWMHVAPGGAGEDEIHLRRAQIEDQQAERRAVVTAIAEETGDGQPFPVGRDGGQRIQAARLEARAGQRAVDDHDRLALRAVQLHPFQREAPAAGGGVIDEIIDRAPIGGDGGGDGAQVIGQIGQRAVLLQITHLVAMPRIPSIAPVRVARAMQQQTARVGRENLRLHVDVTGRQLRVAGQLIHFHPGGAARIEQIRAWNHGVSPISELTPLQYRAERKKTSAAGLEHHVSTTAKPGTIVRSGRGPSGARPRHKL